MKSFSLIEGFGGSVWCRGVKMTLPHFLSNFSFRTSALATVANQGQKKRLFVVVITRRAPLKSSWQASVADS